jgi:hypothetical protein
MRLRGSFSLAESGAVEAHAVRRALVSSEAQDPAWFTLPGSVPGIRTQITRGLNALALPIGLERHGVADQIGLALRPWQGRVLPLTLRPNGARPGN